MELLDLDALESIQKQVTLKGVAYTVADQTVGQMIEALQMSKEANEDPDNPEPIIQALFKTAKRLLPECPVEVIEGLNMKQLSALVEFSSASEEEVSDGAEVEVTDVPNEAVLAEKDQP